MKTFIKLIVLILLSHISYSQEKTAGQFFTESVTIMIGQQIAQQGAGYQVTVARSYLILQGKKYKLYRYTKEKIISLTASADSQTAQQTQQHPSILTEDFYLLGNQQENGKYCLIQGTIDKDAGIIYNAAVIEIFSENKITEALNKCGIVK